jgi:hypothetical protein
MSTQWSQRFSDKFHVVLPPDVIDWLDGPLRQSLDFAQPGEFSEPLDPESILDPSTSVVWGGQMLPDTLPLLDNGCGDVLCLRFGRDRRVSELVRWAHEGGHWQPFGNTLAEAILCDIASSRSRGGLADPERIDDAERACERWAVDWTMRSTGLSLKWGDPYEGDTLSVFRCLVDAGVSEVAARSAFCRASLTSGLEKKCMEIGGGQIANELGVEWPVMATWLFDTARVPNAHREGLRRILDIPIEQIMLQDWPRASREAQRVCELRPDLAWPYAILGWAAEREMDVARAMESYVAGLKALKTSLEYVGNRFVPERLRHLQSESDAHNTTDPYLEAALAPITDSTWPSNLRHFWMREAQNAEERGDHDRAYRCYYSAGWDDFMSDDMEQVLDGLVRSADAAGYTALSRIAKHHLTSLVVFKRCTAVEPASRAPGRSRLGTFLSRLFGSRQTPAI